MKNLILIIFLMLLSCGVTKDKTKTKSEFETAQNSHLEAKNNIKTTIDSVNVKKDSINEKKVLPTQKLAFRSCKTLHLKTQENV